MVEALQWMISILGFIVAIFTVSPRQWTRNLGAWTSFLFSWSGKIVGVIVLVLVPLLIYRELTNPFPDSNWPFNVGGLTEASDISRISGIVDDLNSEGGEHVVRVLVATGYSTFGALEQALETFPANARFEIRILLMDPDSPTTTISALDWPRQSKEGIERLRTLRKTLSDKGVSVDLKWRTYTTPPTVRALAFNDQHLFIGFFEWRRVENGRTELRNQKVPYMYFKKGKAGHDYFHHFFVSWFDYQWERGEGKNSSADLEVNNIEAEQTSA
jgi:hypothetical protein